MINQSRDNRHGYGSSKMYKEFGGECVGYDAKMEFMIGRASYKVA